MKRLIVTFTILFIILLITRLLFGYYVEAVPAFSVLLTPLTWFSVIAGVLALVFIGLTIYNEFRHKGN